MRRPAEPGALLNKRVEFFDGYRTLKGVVIRDVVNSQKVEIAPDRTGPIEPTRWIYRRVGYRENVKQQWVREVA